MAGIICILVLSVKSLKSVVNFNPNIYNPSIPHVCLAHPSINPNIQ